MKLNQYDIIISVVAAISLFLLLGSFVIAFALKYQQRRQQHIREMTILKQTYEQALLQSQIEVQEATFSTLGKELHDNIGQLLSTAKMLISITERAMENRSDTLHTANETLGKAIDELRSLSKSLNKEWLEHFDLVENLTAEVSRINSADSIKVYLSHPDKIYLKADKQIMLFRIIQEAIQNAIKHSCAHTIHIDLSIQPGVLQATIKDDGQGFEYNEIPDGVGILNMKQRTKLLGGIINWKCNEKGCTVVIDIPIKPEEL